MKSFHVLLTTLTAILMMSLAPCPALAGPGETTPAIKGVVARATGVDTFAGMEMDLFADAFAARAT